MVNGGLVNGVADTRPLITIDRAPFTPCYLISTFQNTGAGDVRNPLTFLL
jgi:hypothetical protein